MRRGAWGAWALALVFGGSAHGIIMGQMVHPQDRMARSTVMLLHEGFRETGRGQCSGTLVAPDLVLTAAHCVVNLETYEPYPASRFRIYFGNLERTDDGVPSWMESRAREVLAVIPHPDYGKKLDWGSFKGSDVQDFLDFAKKQPVHDIALVRLRDEAPSDFRHVPLLEDLKLLTEGLTVTIAGYGNIKYYNDPTEPRSRLLRSFNTKIMQARNPHTGMINFRRPTTVRSQEDYAWAMGGMAAGDSGGPGFVTLNNELYVFGVASGYREDLASYENVPDHLEWLRESARTLGSHLP